MRVLLASNGLTTLGGSETYLLTLGRHLQRFGHEVYVLEGPGGEGTLAADAGLLAVRRAADVPAPPDRALVQDAIVAGEVAAAWPDVPQLFVCHSPMHDVQITSAVPSSVAALMAMNDRTADRARAMAGGRAVVRLRQPIDVGHFTPGPPPRAVPRQVLLFGNNKAPWRYEGLEEECQARGIELVRVGAMAGNRVADPLLALRAADVVIGYGRCVLEAMACGRTAYVYDRFGADGWVNADTYATLEGTGFNGAADAEEPGTPDWARMFDLYDAETGVVGHDLARRHHDARDHAVQVLEVLEGLGPVERADPHLSFTLARVWREQWRWELNALGWASELDRIRTELRTTQEELAQARHAVVDAEALARLKVEVADDAQATLAGVLGSRSYKLANRVLRLRPWGRPPT